MPLEIEVKFLDVDHGALRQRLVALGAQCLGRWFESNVVFDDTQRSLKATGTLLRLREKSGRVVLTLKRAVDDCSSDSTTDAARPNTKVCEETETDVADAKGMREILAGLGFIPALRYEKVREKWTLLGCEVCLDSLPFGDFLEIEGDEQDIDACIKALALPRDCASTATYHDLNRQHREAHGTPPDESFVFDDAAKSRLLARRATDGSDKFDLDPLDMRPRSA
ncbi:MAG: class IV adenylate cyclase [Humidesulfovibrio sp.]|nr:class IV adenylate cyclase [Humidesulfovibrio sp.]